jgi:peptidoglycan hydrolase-like protein with peptidoglycan-binding domain
MMCEYSKYMKHAIFAVLALTLVCAPIANVGAQKEHAIDTGSYTNQVIPAPDRLTALQEKIKKLKETIERLRKERQAGGGTSAANPARECSVFKTDAKLRRGVENGNVKALQQFLKDEGDLTGNFDMGFYGPKTEKAVQAWQKRYGVLAFGTPETGFGVVGPRTKAMMYAVCVKEHAQGQGQNSQGSTAIVDFASPSRAANGAKPLKVSFTYSSTTSTSTSLRIDFGDDSAEGALGPCLPATATCTRKPATHTYTKAGTYTARLMSVNTACMGGPSGEGCPKTEVATAKITVSALTGCKPGPNGQEICLNPKPVACTKEYVPVCGQPPFSCPVSQGLSCPLVMPSPQTYSNKCMMEAAGATLVSTGVCGGDAGKVTQ